MRQLKISRSITSRNNEALDRYLNEIAREPMLTPEEEAELATKIHKGGKEGEQARDRLVSANLRFDKRLQVYILCSMVDSAKYH